MDYEVIHSSATTEEASPTMAKATPAAEQLLRHSNEPKDAEDTDMKPHCVCLPSVALDQLFAWDTTIKLGQSNVKNKQHRSAAVFDSDDLHVVGVTASKCYFAACGVAS